MNNPIDEAWRVTLPADIQALLARVNRDARAYPTLGSDWQCVHNSLACGQYDVARRQLNLMQAQQDNLRRGPSAGLQALLQAVRDNPVTYPGRERDRQQAQTYLEAGQYDLARWQLMLMQTQLDNLRRGPSPGLQILLQSVRDNPVTYPGRERDWQQTQTHLETGQYDLARWQLMLMQTQQDNLRRGFSPLTPSHRGK